MSMLRGRVPAATFVRALAGFATALAMWSLAGCATAPSCAEPGPQLVCTAQGSVRGVVENGTVAFKGIPYAQPPMGELRWRKPRAPQPWEGVRDASEFSPVCPQLSGDAVIGDEDCLTLNVWRPQKPSAEPLPVMVFFTGGGNHGFSGQGAPVFGGMAYNGHLLAPEGVVLVTFNYRLGALGFLAHPDLGDGNYGSLDQIEMLRWLKRNIAAFGGDPRRIMLFGTSAGGGNICALMAAPAAKGLFHAAAMHSSVPTGCELPTLAQAQPLGRRIADALGCPSTASVPTCMRGKPADQVVRAVPGTLGLMSRLYGPNVDADVFPEQPLAAIRHGRHTRMPVVIGNTSQETAQFVDSVAPLTDAASYEEALGKLFDKADVPRIMETYPLATQRSVRQAMVQLTTDAFFTCQSLRVARSLARTNEQSVYRYLFDHTLEGDPSLKALGATHTLEHIFFFPWGQTYRPSPRDLAVQRLMSRLWVDMARTGRPGTAWPLAVPGDIYLRVTPAGQPASGDGGAQCAFWDTVHLPSPHL
jgi:para-nitrobenzyl esterase